MEKKRLEIWQKVVKWDSAWKYEGQYKWELQYETEKLSKIWSEGRKKKSK